MKYQIDYFTPRGVLNTSVQYHSLEVYLYNEVARVSGMNREGKLPGIPTGKWDGPMVVTDEDNHKHLILTMY